MCQTWLLWIERVTWRPLLWLLYRYPGTQSCIQISATYLKIRHPLMKSSNTWASNASEWLELQIGHQGCSPSDGHQGGMTCPIDHYCFCFLSAPVKGWWGSHRSNSGSYQRIVTAGKALVSRPGNHFTDNLGAPTPNLVKICPPFTSNRWVSAGKT